jgi:NTE family protein
MKTNKTFTVTGTSLNTQNTYYFNHHTYPNIPVLDAVKISITIPLFFKSNKIILDNTEHTMVDGGVLNNFPLYYYDIAESTGVYPKNATELVNLCDSNIYLKKNYDKIIAIDISVIEIDKNGIYNGYNKINNLFDFVSNFIQITNRKISSTDYMNMLKGGNPYANNIINVNVKNIYNEINFFIDKDTRNELHNIGYSRAQKTIENLIDIIETSENSQVSENQKSCFNIF